MINAFPPTLALAPLDWGVLLGYGLLLVFTGVILTRRKPRTADEYFLADRNMPVWAVAVSLLATVQSAATFVGVPEQGFRGDLRYVSTSIGALLAALILVWFFLPVYYRMNLSTPYQLLATRFGPGASLGASWTYMVGRVFASGARVFIGAIPFAYAVFGNAEPPALLVSIAGFMVFSIFFTLVGGVRSVIWTDVLQVVVYLGAAVALLVTLLWSIPASASEIVGALDHPPEGPSKLTMFRLGLDAGAPLLGFNPADQFTIPAIVFGFTLVNLAAHATDQDLLQRLLTCRSSFRAGLSAMTGTLIGIPVVMLFGAIGLLLYIYYQRPDALGAAHAPAEAAGSSRLLVSFAMREMPAGMAGLVIAGLLAAGPAGTNASLNAMSSSFVNDTYRPRFAGRPGSHYLRVGRVAVVAWGLVLGAFAGVCVYWQQASGQTLIDFALSVMTFAYAGLMGVFLVALFSRRGSSTSAVAGLATGFLVVLALQPAIWRLIVTGHTAGIAADPFSLRGWLQGVTIAYPWQMVLGTAAAALVCAAGRRRAGESRA